MSSETDFVFSKSKWLKEIHVSILNPDNDVTKFNLDLSLLGGTQENEIDGKAIIVMHLFFRGDVSVLYACDTIVDRGDIFFLLPSNIFGKDTKFIIKSFALDKYASASGYKIPSKTLENFYKIITVKKTQITPNNVTIEFIYVDELEEDEEDADS